MPAPIDADLSRLATQIAMAYVQGHRVGYASFPDLYRSAYRGLSACAQMPPAESLRQTSRRQTARHQTAPHQTGDRPWATGQSPTPRRRQPNGAWASTR